MAIKVLVKAGHGPSDPEFFGVAASQSAIVKRLAALEGSATQTSVRASPRLEIEMHGDGSV